MSALGNGSAGPGHQMQVQIVEKRTFASFGWEVGPPLPGPSGVPVRELLFATPNGTVYAFPLDVMGLAALRSRLAAVAPAED